MPSYKVAHVRQQGIDLIIVPLDRSFGSRMESEQQTFVADLQLRARSAGLAGTVVPVWDNGSGRMAFIAAPNWHAFFGSLSLRVVAANVDKRIYWEFGSSWP